MDTTTTSSSTVTCINNKLLSQLDVYDSRERRESGFVEDYDSCSDSSRRNSDNYSPSPDIFRLELEAAEVAKKIEAVAAAAASQQPATTIEGAASSPSKTRRIKKKKKRLCESLSVAHFTDAYSLTGEVLGEGSYGRVQTCRHNLTQKHYAVKIISKQSWHFSRPKILKEIELYYLCQVRKSIMHPINKITYTRNLIVYKQFWAVKSAITMF